ncbi:hypothetical protein D3C83_40760 [compost metagenome]
MSAAASKPSWSIATGRAADSTRITTSSRPLEVGTVATRNSTRAGPKRLNSILPSCGRRRSVMSSWLMILMREITARRNFAGSSR